MVQPACFIGSLMCLVAPLALFATIDLCGVAFFNDLNNPASWAYKQDVGGRYIGAVTGRANMWVRFAIRGISRPKRPQ